jgi:putative ABC transport system permease protein
MKPSFKKVMRDLLQNKSRSLTVLLAIILGAFGVSMMSTAYNLLGRNLNKNYLNTNPAAFTIVVDSLPDAILQKAKQLPNIEFIETRNKIIGRVEISKNEFVPIWLYLIDDFQNLRINTFRLTEGELPSSTNQLLIERTARRLVDIQMDKDYAVTVPGYRTSSFRISGIVHDPGQAPSWMEGLLYGYASRDFLKKMNIKNLPVEVKFTIKTNKYDLPAIESQLRETVSLFEKNNIKIERTEILTPGKHVHQSQMDSLMFLLQMFGVLALLLSCFLIINMIMAIMSKEIRQIGIMKAIGASTGKITSIYLTIVLMFGFVATLIALPIGYMAGRGYSSFVASMLNFELFDQKISHGVLLFQIAIGILLPAIIAFIPVYRSSQISVHKALNDYGVNDTISLKSDLSTQLTRIMKLTNSTKLAIRNTFRRKGRLILTLITLVLGGAVFISAFNIRYSLKETVKSRFTNQKYDILTIFSKGVNEADFKSSIDSLPFIDAYETWGYARGTRIAGQFESDQFDLKLVPTNTILFVPEIMKGEWLNSNTEEVVVNHTFFSKFPDITIGKEITIKANGRTKTIRIIGCVRELFAPPTVYLNRSVLAEWPEMLGKVNCALITYRSENKDMAINSSQLEQWFKDKKYPVSLVFRKDQYKDRVIDHLVIITTMLIMVSLLLIIVGGLGLITSMGINIVERLRELSVLRAIGVTNRNLYRITTTEGFVIGLLSWVFSVLLSIPVSMYLGNKFFTIFFETTLNFNVSATGIIVWLAIIIVFSAFAVLVPAKNSTCQSVAEGLSYE